MTNEAHRPPDLPAAVSTYLQTHVTAAPAAISALFAADAVVTDDGRTYRGRDQIFQWRTELSMAFTYTTTRLTTDREGLSASVTERVEGDFPGGRVDLRSTFGVDLSGAITTLKIEVAD